jgi:hypothetical protein
VQAGFSLRFQYADQPLAEAALYLVPSAQGGSSLSRASWLELLERVRAGATLYLSLDDGILSPFEEAFGVRVRTRERRTGPAAFSLDGVAEASWLPIAAKLRLGLEATRAEVLAREPDGNPVFTRTALGKGEAYLLAVPIEDSLSRTPGAFDGAAAALFWRIYARVGARVLDRLVARRDAPQVGVTEHPLDERRRVVVLINYAARPARPGLRLAEGWRVERALHGKPDTIPACDACVLEVRREGGTPR